MTIERETNISAKGEEWILRCEDVHKSFLGVKAVIAKSFERIHRSNLIGMGVVPLQFLPGEDAATHGLKGDEVISIAGIESGLAPKKQLKVTAGDKTFTVIARIDTPQEVEYVIHGGILQYVLRQRAAGGHLVGVGRPHDQRAQTAHFGVQQADSVVGGIVGAEGVGADQLGKPFGLMGLGHPYRAHLVQDHGDAGIGDLPGGFRAGEAAADDVNGMRHGAAAKGFLHRSP